MSGHFPSRAGAPNAGRTFETGKCYRVRDAYFRLEAPMDGRWGFPNWWSLTIDRDGARWQEAIPHNSGYPWVEVGEEEFLCALLTST
jgi:hypothetical protein